MRLIENEEAVSMESASRPEAMEREIERIIRAEMEALNRPDLFREPLVGFSSAQDPRYEELRQLVGDWHKTPVELLPSARSVVSFFVPFTRAVVAEPATVQDGSHALIWAEAYVVINAHFERINASLARYLADLGFEAESIPATHTYDPKTLKTAWSHRSAAAVAGLGAFGANRLLITEKGSGGRFCSLLTSAPLMAEREPAPNRCLYLRDGSCGLCFTICPVQALEPGGFHRFVCKEELNKNARNQAKFSKYSANTCGKCISICPVSYLN